MSSKIEKDLEELVTKQVITSEVQLDIQRYYVAKKVAQPNTLLVVFGVLGSILTGLGIILILAHNWDDFSRTTKTIWAFAPLVAGQVLAAFALFKKKNDAWRETAATFLFFAIGASISLVSQIYNIPGAIDSFLLTWIILAAPLLYLLKSHATALLYIILATSYGCMIGYDINKPPYWALLALAGVLPHYVSLLKTKPNGNITGIFHWILPLSFMFLLGAFLNSGFSIGLLTHVCLFGLFYNLGKLPYFENQKLRRNGYLIIGSLGTIISLLIASFSYVWDDFIPDYISNNDLGITSIISLAAAGIVGYLFTKNKLKPFNLFQFAFLVFGGLYIFGFFQPEIASVLTNILILVLGLLAVIIGSRQEKFSILNYGLLIITTLISCRFFDTEIPFVVRGLLFIAIGAGFFGANYFMYKKQSKSNGK
ncbi:DUF2157 domain-containing protein [Rasiella sp. SM2506]|uniref:DUF2157 domain-containing protein n=1 Tax=Rasiella sp. SM2506 TaxID=3423914 RepID=UPI003D7A87DB